MRTKTTMIMNKKLGRRRPKRMPYEEPIRRDGALWSAKKKEKTNKKQQEELGKKGQRNNQKKQHSGEKGTPEKEQP